MRALATAAIVLAASACGTTRKPCHEGGDVLWDWGPKPVKGNKQCLQIQDKSGRWVNEGRYVVWHPNGRIALEGTFKAGAKVGKWVQYDEDGKKVVERVFEEGREQQPTATQDPARTRP